MKQNNSDEEQIIRTVCNSHCGGICEIKAHVKGGRLIRLESGEGDESYHRACARGRAYRQRVYAADRLLYPLKRRGTRGTGEFTRISWDEALDTIALEMKKAREIYGPSSILHFCSMCDPHTLHHVQAIHRLLCQFGGYTAPWGTISNEGMNFAAGVTYGTAYGVEPTPFDLMKSRLIIMWGWNPAVTAMGTDFPLLLAQARERGARIIAIDPRFTDSVAVFADQWIPIRPGTDVAVLLAMAYVMINENLQDQSFLNAWTVGFDKFKDYVLGVEDGLKKSPEWAEAISGTPAQDIVNMAREFANTRPALLMAGFAAGRTAYGEQFHRAVYTLMAMTGNTAIPAQPSGERSKLRALRNSIQLTSPPNRVEMDSPPRWNALPYRGASVNNAARVNVSQFAEAILKGKAAGYPADYKVLWLSNTNYLNQLGDVNKTARALQKLDFILVTEQFMTATAKFADIVLPVCTYLERQDIFASGTGDSYGVLNKAIEPLGESKSQLQICEALAPRLGITDYNDKTDAQWAESIAGTL